MNHNEIKSVLQEKDWALFKRLSKQKDLILIASNCQDAFCKCDNVCICSNDFVGDGIGSIDIYRSLKYPEISFLEFVYFDLDLGCDKWEVSKFESDVIEDLVDKDIDYRPELYFSEIFQNLLK